MASDSTDSDSAADVVRRYLSAVQRARQEEDEDSWNRVAELLATNVRWRFAGGGADTLWRRELSGRAALLASLSHPANTWSRLRTATTSVLACGSTVVVEQISTIVDENSAELVKPVAHIFTVDAGRITEVRTYRNDVRGHGPHPADTGSER
jgi:ketosteroid isomerase-like protein